MPEVNVIRAFDLVRDNGSEQRFYPGVQQMSEADASHWQTMANLDNAGSIPPRPGSYEFHTLHPAIQNLNSTMLVHEQRERDALAEEDVQIANMRAQRAAERREEYNDDLVAVREGKPLPGVQQSAFEEAFTGAKTDPNAPRSLFPTPGSLPNSAFPPHTDNSTEEAKSGDGPGETQANRAVKREKLVKPQQPTEPEVTPTEGGAA